MPQRPKSWTSWPRKLADGAYPGKISRQNRACEAISYSPRTFALLCGLRAPAPSAHLLSSCCAPESGQLPGARPALGACPAGQKPDRLLQPMPGWEKATSQPTAGRAWLWRSFRNPYNFIGQNGYVWMEPQKKPLLGNIMILQKTSSPMVEPQTSRAGSSGQ